MHSPVSLVVSGATTGVRTTRLGAGAPVQACCVGGAPDACAGGLKLRGGGRPRSRAANGAAAGRIGGEDVPGEAPSEGVVEAARRTDGGSGVEIGTCRRGGETGAFRRRGSVRAGASGVGRIGGAAAAGSTAEAGASGRRSTTSRRGGSPRGAGLAARGAAAPPGSAVHGVRRAPTAGWSDGARPADRSSGSSATGRGRSAARGARGPAGVAWGVWGTDARGAEASGGGRLRRGSFAPSIHGGGPGRAARAATIGAGAAVQRTARRSRSATCAG